MTVLLSYDPEMTAYRFGDRHPMMPERFSLAVDLMRSWSFIADGIGGGDLPRAEILSPTAATDDELAIVHSRDYIRFVRNAQAGGNGQGHGIGLGDTPAFRGMHDAAALAVGGTLAAVRAVLSGRATRAHAPAGGLHHAQSDHASGFCIYNDCAVGIAQAIHENPGLRIAYVDIDAHHGDGVETAFYERSDVLTFSVHESGRYLFPGSGRASDIGLRAGVGYAMNVALPPYADPACYELVLRDALVPALHAYGPDLIVLQAGGDSHRGDPLTHLHQSVAGFCSLVEGVIALADGLTSGRIVVLGGGGYQPFTAVPRMWAGIMALLLGRPVPEELPGDWAENANEAALRAEHELQMQRWTFEETVPDLEEGESEAVLQGTASAINQLRVASPLLGGAR